MNLGLRSLVIGVERRTAPHALLYFVVTDSTLWESITAAVSMKIGRVMFHNTCFGTYFALKDLSPKYEKTKIILYLTNF